MKNIVKMNLKSYRYLKENYILYLFLLPAVVYLFVFHYIPIYGVQIAFKDFIPAKGIWDSSWVGLMHFERFFQSPNFFPILRNTLLLNFYVVIVSFPIPIALAIMFNYCPNQAFKKVVQNITYAPHFISLVVMVGIISVMLSPQSGVINTMLEALGRDRIFFMSKPELFRHIYVWSDVWQHSGYNAIIFIAALANVDPVLHESASIDGANKYQRVWNIDIPYIMPIAMILLILKVGRVMNVGYVKAFLMQNPYNLESSEVIATYIYKVGLLGFEYSYSTAVGLFNNLINLLLLIFVNTLSKRLTDTSLW